MYIMYVCMCYRIGSFSLFLCVYVCMYIYMYVCTQDPKAYCCGCLPELNSGLLGLRVLHESQKALNKLVANTSDSKLRFYSDM